MTASPATPHRLPTGWIFDGCEALDLCHHESLAMLAQLEALVDRIEDIGPDPQACRMAEAVEQHFSTTVLQHHEDEERHVFPMLALNGSASTQQLLARLKQDHAWMSANWFELQPQVDAIACGQSWVDVDRLRETVAVLAQLIREHIALEESLVYPPFRESLSDVTRGRMNDEMRERRGAVGAREGITARA